MARIRSVHPGQWTDEDFVSCSAYARLLAIALRNEADDQGVFEWKPIGLKMKLFPADAVDINDLLAELVTFNQIKNFEHDGRKYGAIRNFRLYQRPKKPNQEHVLPDEFRTYVGLTDAIGEPDGGEDAEVPPNREKPPQMEDEGGNRREGGKKKEKLYAFRGSVIALNQSDFDSWSKAYHAIPDLLAELHRIDDGFRVKAPDNWFMAASAMLSAKHQKFTELAETKGRLRDASGMAGRDRMHPGAGG